MIYKKIRQSKNKNGNKTIAKMVGSNPYAKHADIAGSVKKGTESSYDENNVYAQEAALNMKEPITKKASGMKLTQCKAAGPLKNVNELKRRTSSGNNSGSGDYDNRYKTGDIVVKDGKRYKVTESRTYQNTKKPDGPKKPSSGPFKNPAVPGQTYQEFLDAPCPSPGKPLTNPHCQGQEGTQNIGLDPIMNTETNTTPASQQYNMGYAQAENANWARGAMRRGTNREERKDMKAIVKSLSPEQRDQFRKNMKAQRNVDINKDGKVSIGEKLKGIFGGSRQQKKLNALKGVTDSDGNPIIDPNRNLIRTDRAMINMDPNSEEYKQKLESLTMNKYNIPINRYGDFKPGETTTNTFQELEQEGDTQFEGVEGERQINFGDNNTDDSNTIKNDEVNADAVTALSSVLSGGLFFKLKNKGFGRGAGYEK
jgi:hypothetical protein